MTQTWVSSFHKAGSLNVVIVPPPPTSLNITSPSPITETQGQPFTKTLTAAGGSGTYVNWTILAGALNPFASSLAQPTPTPAVNLNFSGVLVGAPLPNAETGAVTIQVTDSAGNTAQKVISLVTNPAAFAFQQKFLVGGDNQFSTNIDPANAAHYVNINAWDGNFGHILNARSSRLWEAGLPFTFVSGSGVTFGYPFCNRGWYPAQANPCATINGGTSSAPGVNSCIQISALTKAKMRVVMEIPNDRNLQNYDTLEDLYVYSAATPGGGAGASFSNAQTLLALSLVPNFLDTALFWQTFIGTKNLTAGSLALTDYANTAGVPNRVVLDHRLWFYNLSNNTFAAPAPAGKFNTLRLFPAPWNDTSHVGSKFLYVDVAQLLADLLASSLAGLVPITAAHFLGNLAHGYEFEGGVLQTITAINTATNTITYSGTRQLPAGTVAGFAAVGGTVQLNQLIGKVLSAGGSSGAWTATVDTPMAGFGAFTSGGLIHNSVYRTLDFQTAMQGEPDPVIPVGPEISKNISRYQPAYSPSAVLQPVLNGNSSNCNLMFASNGVPTGGAPSTWAVDLSGVADADMTNVMWSWSGANGNDGYLLATTFGIPGNYTLEVNTAPFTGGVMPAAGWAALVTVTANTRTARTHLLGDCSPTGARGRIRSIRMVVTALCTNDVQSYCQFHVDVVNAPQTTGAPDGHLFIGDSVANKCLQIWDCEEGGLADSPGNHLYNITGHIPITECASTSTWSLNNAAGGFPAALPFLNGTSGSWITDFPGRYIHLMLGINDGGTTQTNYQTPMAQVTNIALAAKKVVVIPSIWWVQQNPAGSLQFSGYNSNLVNLAITGISQAASAVATMNYVSTVNPLAVGQQVLFSAVVGMVQINGLAGSVTAIGGSSGAWTATTNINSSAFSAYVSGGQMNRPNVIAGPDLYNMGLAFQSIMHNASDNIHPSPYGQAIYRGCYMDWIGRVIYLGTPANDFVFDFSVGAGIGGH